MPVIRKRNYLVSRFLKRSEAEWLIFLDSDMVPESDSLLALVEAARQEDLDVVAAHCFTRHGVPFRACGGWCKGKEVTWIGAEALDGSIREVDWVGTGCVYLSRRILAKMAELRGPEVFLPEQGMEWADRGEDQEFCRSARAVGFRLHYHTGAAVGHLGLTNIDDDFVGRLAADPEPEETDCITEVRSNKDT